MRAARRIAIILGLTGTSWGLVALPAFLPHASRAPGTLRQETQGIGTVVVNHGPGGPRCPLLTDEVRHVPHRPALAIKVENLPEARPQAGLNKADIVYEEPVEGGVTRFIAIFQCEQSSRVGPVRSARMTDSLVLPEYGHPVFGYAGGVPRVEHAVDAAGVRDENYGVAGQAYVRDPHRPAPHNLYTSTKRLWRAGAKFHEGPPSPVFEYRALPPTGKKTRFIHLHFSWSSDVYWRWNQRWRVWLRFHGPMPHLLESNVQVSAKNVVVQLVRIRYDGLADVIGSLSPEAITVGTGRAYVLRNGRMIAGKWVRANVKSPTKFETLSGRTIPLAPGNTWVELFPKNLNLVTGR